MLKLRNALCLGLAVTMLPSAGAFAAPADANGDVVRLGQTTRFDYRPGQVIVKFKDSSRVKIPAATGMRRVRSAGVGEVDRAFAAIGVTGVENLMPLTGGNTLRRSMPAFNGRPVEARAMDRAYVLTISADVAEATRTLAALDDVEYVEPNYVVHSLAFEEPDDPFFSQQWGLADINIFKLWGEPVNTKEGPVVAIIDTGVDIEHPDLKDNIWTNTREQAGLSDYDDDGNGYADDLHGWDFVNNTGLIADYNGHGTHCAGIVAAKCNNGIGVVGANPYARIMPLTAMQSNGQGDIATLIKAVDYATANGAEIISMSLGTYAESMAFEEALARAYQKTIIVAAAGNDGYCLNHAHPEKGQRWAMPMFPAAYTFVLGVQATGSSRALADFSNYDDDGPAFSPYSEEKLYNYEIAAPGVGIISTFPNGNYRSLSGTSMATPLVAGAVSRLLMSKSVENKEEFFGDLINACNGGVLDIYAAYSISDAQRTPELQLVSVRVDDSDGDGDGRIDAGETIRFYPTLRNNWGNARNIRYSVSVAEEANNFCEIKTAEAEFGFDLSSYAKGAAANPVEIVLKSDVADGRLCRFMITATCDGIAEPLQQEFELTAENGVELSGILRSDMTLHPDTHYIVNGMFGVPEGVTLTIEPGTKIKFKSGSGLAVEGTIIADGQQNNMIVFTCADNKFDGFKGINFGRNQVSYCLFENLYWYMTAPIAKAHRFENCVLRDCSVGYTIYLDNDEDEFYKCNIYNNHGIWGAHTRGQINKCNFTQNDQEGSEHDHTLQGKRCFNSNVYSNYFEGNSYSLGLYSGVEFFTPKEPNYLGSSDVAIVSHQIVDNHWPNCGSYGEYDLSNMLTRPNAEAHGIVWKVVVNGYDAQDEYDMLPPLGVGRHKVEVYFNRPMDKSTAPDVAMGVRPPYTQTAIGEDGSWNEAGDIYTAYFTVTGRQNIDGVNRISVSGARDDEYFDIPREDNRFNVNVQAAGSLSTGFFGESGVGCVKLEWEDMDMNFDDILGYNLYRSTVDGDTVRVNERLIDAGTTRYTDYDVKTGTTYLYYYKVMTTALSENSPSKTVAVTPLTAERGDANGSGLVDINDILTTVNYIGGAEPKPFIYEAADMNADEDINILDVVGIAHAILGSPAETAAQAVPQTAYYWIEDGQLWLNTADAVGGIQVQLSAERSGARVAPAADLASLETMGQWCDGGRYMFLAFSVSGSSLPAGEHAVLNVGSDFDVERIVLGDTSVNPQEIPVQKVGMSGVGDVTVDTEVPASTGIYNVLGVKLADDASDLDRLPAGIYIVNGSKLVKR